MSNASSKRDHGGGVDAAVALYGGQPADWLDLSTGINPVPFPVVAMPDHVWTALPDRDAQANLIAAARAFWNVPLGFDILPVHGASAAISRLPAILGKGTVDIPAPTYNEHAAAFDHHQWPQSNHDPDVRVLVNPNNPDGRTWGAQDLTAPFTIIDESFCDTDPAQSVLADLDPTRGLVLKSFGKFWGLAGLRLGFVIAAPTLISRLSDLTGPWSVSGPALHIGTAALRDQDWAVSTRIDLVKNATRLDALMTTKGSKCVGGTSLFRLYAVDDAAAWQKRLAQGRVWSRIFPYSTTWLRLGLPGPDGWDQLEAAL